MQPLIEVYLDVLKRLEKNNIAYMVVGSVASMVYGEPRMTHDLDLVIQVHPQDAEKFTTTFATSEFYCPPIELLRAEIIHYGQFNLLHHESGLKIDLVVRKNTEHAKREFERRRKLSLWKDNEIFVASPEDIIIKKLDYFRQGGSEKHLKDIRGILAQTDIDQHYLNDWINKLNLVIEWQQAQA